jgi:hypothetical protein
MESWREIAHRGGVVRLRIPGHWVSEYGDDGTNIMFDPIEDTRSLRLHVLTLRAPEPITATTMRTLLASLRNDPGQEASVRELGVGRAVLVSTHHSEEDGQQIVMKRWELGAPVTAWDARIAMFTYTCLQSDFPSADVQSTLGMLDQAICAADFAPVLGALGPDA